MNGSLRAYREKLSTRSLRAFWALAWLVSRLLLVLAIRHPHHGGARVNLLADPVVFQRWADEALTGDGLPRADQAWQYPPGAMAVFLLVDELPGSYLRNLVGLMLAVDLVILMAVLRQRTTAGACLWVVGPLALGQVVLTRFDLVPTMFAVLGTVLVGQPVLAGAMLGVGAWVKVWPALLLPPDGRPRRVVRRLFGAAVVSAGAITVLAVTGQLGVAGGFLGNQKTRGLQIESVAATPFMLARAAGDHGHLLRLEFGATDVVGPGTSAVAALCPLGQVAATAWFVLAIVRSWRRGEEEDSAGLGLVLLLLLMVTSRVQSPQYLVWPLGLAAVCLARRPRDYAAVAGVLLAACALTQWVYPAHYRPLLSADPAVTALLAIRNVLLLVTVALAGRARRGRGSLSTCDTVTPAEPTGRRTRS